MRKQWKIVTVRTINIKLKTGKNMMKSLDEVLIYQRYRKIIYAKMLSSPIYSFYIVWFFL